MGGRGQDTGQDAEIRPGAGGWRRCQPVRRARYSYRLDGLDNPGAVPTGQRGEELSAGDASRRRPARLSLQTEAVTKLV